MAEKRKLAFYIRLSDADEEVKAGTKDESNSITGQRKLLYAYIKKTEEFAGFEVLEYFDDGYSGTMFNNRAEFQRLIQDAELGRFECIIVKDFSRFGRDYLEVGNYLEFVFPAMGMRFISVNDNYDSDRNFGVTGGMDVAYKNLIYQLYSMDLSRKVKSARRTRNLSGEYTASFVCYGYKKDPDDKHKLIIDEEAAKVVVEIFSLIIAGYNASEVARMLNERKIPTRVQNQWKNGINYVPVHNKGDYMWDNSEVIAIVQNEQYKGIMIQNKCETVGFGDNKKVRKRNKEDWSVVEGAIPRIVSDEMFDEVNKMLRVEARGIEKSTKKRKKNLFICPYCGRKLMNSSAVCTPKLLCPKRRMVRTGECQQIFMLKSEAQDKVLEITKEICRTLIQEEELKKASKDKRKVTSDEYLISELKAEYDRISNSTVSCYQSYREGKYTKEEYVQLRKKNQELLADLENQISDLQEKVANQEPDAEEKIEQLTQYSMLEQYDGDVLSNIIDKVFIYNDTSKDEMTIRHQFDRLCQMALKGEAVNYYKHMDYRRKHEVTVSELSEKELSKLFTMDEYGTEYHHFEVHGYDIEVKNTLIAEALKELTERKRNVILLSYFMEMSDADIAREMNLVRSTIHEHRTRSLEILKKIMEGIADEKDV